jgi:Kdo2-lipid IVA lauroyltransferase/acyltransferase
MLKQPAGPRPPLGPASWPHWAAIAMLAALARLPWPMQQRLGHWLGHLLHRVMRKRRRVAERNIALCWPERSARERQGLLRDHFAALGLAVFEFSRAWWYSVEPQRHGLVIEGADNLTTARAAGKGVILVSGHFTTLEICARLACEVAPLAGMYRPYRQAAWEWAVSRGRARYSAAMFGKQDVRGAVRHLRAGGVLWYAPDQDPSRGDSVYVPFFGHPAHSLNSTHHLARLTSAAVVMFQHWRRADGGYTLRFFAPLQAFPSASATDDTARVIAAIEVMARQVPDQYLWIHRRFKRQPSGTSAYAGTN